MTGIVGALNSHQWERADLEWYVDPPSCADALFKVETFDGTVLDPFCGMGNVVRMGRANGIETRGSDLSGRFARYRKADFFRRRRRLQNTVCNPAYGKHPEGGLRLEDRAVVHALQLSDGKVATLCRLAWMRPRMAWLRDLGCARIWVLDPRPSMLPGHKILTGEMPKDGKIDYAWFVFPERERRTRRGEARIEIDVARRDTALDTAALWHWRLDQPSA